MSSSDSRLDRRHSLPSPLIHSFHQQIPVPNGIFIVLILLDSVNDGDSTKPEDSTEEKPEPTVNSEEKTSDESKEEAPSDEESEHTEL